MTGSNLVITFSVADVYQRASMVGAAPMTATPPTAARDRRSRPSRSSWRWLDSVRATARSSDRLECESRKLKHAVRLLEPTSIVREHGDRSVSPILTLAQVA